MRLLRRREIISPQTVLLRTTFTYVVICGLSLLLVLVFAARGFSPGTPVFPSPQKPTFPNSNSIRNPRATGLSVLDCCVSPSLNKVDLFLFIYLFIYSPRRSYFTDLLYDSWVQVILQCQML